jgi:PhoH-like ATPase
MYIELRGESNGKATALGKVSKDKRWILKIEGRKAGGITPRNREQVFALDALLDDSITVVVLTGASGSGKTLLSLCAAIEKRKKYGRVILTRPMSYVGKYSLGALPGGFDEKFSPYLLNFTTNLEQLVGKAQTEDAISQFGFEIIPLQLIRGASFVKCFILFDECQVVNHMEMLTVGSRVGEGSKIVIMGDLQQRDENISKDKTGIFKMIHDLRAKESPLVASIELQKCERSETAAMFASVFEDV